MATGVIKWFNDIKGFGFIEQADGSGDLFVHISAVKGKGRKSLEDGDRVSYSIVNGPRGPQAQEVQKV